MGDNGTKSKWWDWVWKILTALVIPLIIWGIKLEVNNALQNERIGEAKEAISKLEATSGTMALEVNTLKEKIANLKKDHEKSEKMAVAIGSNTNALVRLETKLDGISESIHTIKTILRSP